MAFYPSEYPHETMHFELPKAVQFHEKCFIKCLHLPGVPWLFKRTFWGSCIYTQRLSRKKKTIEAINHLQSQLSASRFRTKHPQRWWALMRQAITMAQEYQLGGHAMLKKEIQVLMKLTEQGPQPHKGYDVAYCYVGLGLWAFQWGDGACAIHLVQQAIEADTDWGYPDYLMGWLALFEKDIDPIPYFVNSLAYNWSFFHRIMNDPICRQFPDILKEVRQGVVFQNQNIKG